MAYKMKYDFYVPSVRQVALDNVPLNTKVKNRCSYFSIVKNDQNYSNKMIVCSGGRFWSFLQGLKMARFI